MVVVLQKVERGVALGVGCVVRETHTVSSRTDNLRLPSRYRSRQLRNLQESHHGSMCAFAVLVFPCI